MDIKKIHAALDRIEDGFAALELEDGTVSVPAALLPEGSREGDRFWALLSPGGEILGIETDADGAEKARLNIRDKKQRLFRQFSPNEGQDGQHGEQE